MTMDEVRRRVCAARRLENVALREAAGNFRDSRYAAAAAWAESQLMWVLVVEALAELLEAPF